MAITAASFIPESRKGGGGAGGGPSAGHAASVSHGVDDSYNHGTDSATAAAAHESTPANHPVTGTALPKGTGAGKGTVRVGGRKGK